MNLILALADGTLSTKSPRSIERALSDILLD
jgi:hypothetical protein